METNVQKGKIFDYKKLDQFGSTIVEYVWIGGKGSDIRSKSKTYNFEVKSVEDLDEWNYDGSSTHQATTENSEVVLKPVALFNDPFRGLPNKIVLCETYIDDKPTNTNFRHFAREIFTKENVEKHDPWFGFEQEYAVSTKVGNHLEWPLGWPVGGFPQPQGPYYCSVGANSNGREIMESHYKACLYAGVKCYGTNAEVMPGQWEYQVGTCKGIEAADHMWMARYLLHRVSEYFNVSVSFEPKPILGNWNGSGCHTNFSNNETRNDTEMQNIKEQIERLATMHLRTIPLYGENNHLRLTGKHETSSMDSFSYGVANRKASVRIPSVVGKTGRGYYEDRRPAANIDPYVVSSILFSITELNNRGFDAMEQHYKDFLEAKGQINH